MFRLRLLGGASLEGPLGSLRGRAVQRRPLALLAILAAGGEKGVSRPKLASYLWPDRDEASGRHLLSDTLYGLRQALSSEAILASGDVLFLNPDVLWSDAWAFDAALARGESEAAAELYEGPFLDGFHLDVVGEFGPWMESTRRHLARSYAEATEELAERAEQEGNWRGAVGWWQRLDAHDPYNSRVAQRLMQALTRAGDRANAILFAEDFAGRLRRDLGVEPDPELLSLTEMLRHGPAPAEPATSASASARLGDLRPADDLRLLRRSHARHEAPVEAGRELAGRPGNKSRALLFVVTAALATLAIVAGVRLIGPPDPGVGDPLEAKNAVAVIPFENVGGNADDQYLVDGIHLEILTHLYKVPGLRSVSRTSVLQYQDEAPSMREIAEALGVEAVLEGSVQRSSDIVRISVRLTDAAEDRTIWAKTYDRSFTAANVLSIQSEVAEAIVASMRAHLPLEVRERIRRRPTESHDAYDAYLRAYPLVEQWIRLEEAAAYLETAIKLDPGFAAAYARLSNAVFGTRLTNPMALDSAKALAMRAIELDDQLGEAHAALGLVQDLEGSWASAEREYRRGMELSPNYPQSYVWLAEMMAHLGRVDEAILLVRQARRIDPLSPSVGRHLGTILYLAGDYEEAIDELSRHVVLQASEYERHGALTFLGLAHIGTGQYSEAIEADRLHATLERLAYPGAPECFSACVMALAAMGHHDSATDMLARYESWGHRPKDRARAHAFLGEVDRAIELLEHCAERDGLRLVYPKTDRVWDGLRSDPRFADVVRRAGIE